MVKRIVLPAVCLAALFAASPSGQSDLDSLMAQVLSSRDQNWKKLQQYTLVERETLQITALAVIRLFGYDREYLWFPRQGFFVRSPVRMDGSGPSIRRPVISESSRARTRKVIPTRWR